MKISTIHLSATDTPQKQNILRYLGWGINVLSILAISAHWGGGFMAVITACLLTLVLPPIAAIFAFFAAISAWGWPWYLSLLVFLWPIVFLILGIGIFGSAYLWMRHKLSAAPVNAESEAIDVEYEIIEEPPEKP
mgnify:CR=1 FL=1|jgi:hypothetical protein|tara:strand:+ start:87399 stop:87803 length:405 start_codon:yes stop_codon:yes gene_type:complete